MLNDESKAKHKPKYIPVTDRASRLINTLKAAKGGATIGEILEDIASKELRTLGIDPAAIEAKALAA